MGPLLVSCFSPWVSLKMGNPQPTLEMCVPGERHETNTLPPTAAETGVPIDARSTYRVVLMRGRALGANQWPRKLLMENLPGGNFVRAVQTTKSGWQTTQVSLVAMMLCLHDVPSQGCGQKRSCAKFKRILENKRVSVPSCGAFLSSHHTIG